MDKRQEEIIVKLYDDLFAEMRVYANAVLKDAGLAEEAVQETFLIACIKADTLMASSNRRGWLFLTLRNVCLHMQRSRRKILNNIMKLSFVEKTKNRDNGELADIKPEFWYNDLTADKDYEILHKLAVDGYSIKELAAEYGISISACKQRISRAKQRFRKMLDQGQEKSWKNFGEKCN